jgi:hypothetical protein
MSAIISCTSWYDAIGWPNCSRWPVYATVSSRQPWTMPTQLAAIVTRPLSSVCIAILKPWPTSPSSASAGTRTPSNDSAAVAWPRRPSLPLISVASKPGVSVGTRNAETPRGPSSLVRAKTRATSAQVPLVMNTLEPSITQSSPSRRARVRRLPASEPWPGSVSPKQPRIRPAAMSGSQRCFCPSVPCRRTDVPNSPEETETMPRIAESARPNSSAART